MLVVASERGERDSDKETKAFKPLPSSWQSTFKVLNPTSALSQLHSTDPFATARAPADLPSIRSGVPALLLFRFWLCPPSPSASAFMSSSIDSLANLVLFDWYSFPGLYLFSSKG